MRKEKGYVSILCLGVMIAVTGSASCQSPADGDLPQKEMLTETVYLQHPRGNGVSFPVLEQKIGGQLGTITRKEAIEHLSRELNIEFIISPDFDCVCHVKEFWAEKLRLEENSIQAREILRRIWKEQKIALRGVLIASAEGAEGTHHTILIIPQHPPVIEVGKVEGSPSRPMGEIQYQPLDFPSVLDLVTKELPPNKHRQISYDEQLTAVTITDTSKNIKKFKVLFNVVDGRALPGLWW